MSPLWVTNGVCFQDPLPQTVKQVHTAFGLLLDLDEDCGPHGFPDAAPCSHPRELHTALASKLLQLRESLLLAAKAAENLSWCMLMHWCWTTS